MKIPRCSFIIITIRKESYDYEMLMHFLQRHTLVKELNAIKDGFFIRFYYTDLIERRRLIKFIVLFDIDELMFYDLLQTEFLSKQV